MDRGPREGGSEGRGWVRRGAGLDERRELAGAAYGSCIAPQLQDPGVIFPEEFLRASKGVPRAEGPVSHR